MGLTIGKASALKVLRMLRRRELGRRVARRCELDVAMPTGYGWTRAAIETLLAPFPSLTFSSADPLHVVMRKGERRIRVKGVQNIVYSNELPHGAFLDLGNGVAISSPELLFLEMARELPEAELLLLGMELCGSYALPAGEGAVRYKLAPVSSAEKIAAFLSRCRAVHGLGPAKRVCDMLVDNAWSPMEAVLAALLILPATSYGYELGPIVLNRRFGVKAASGQAESRVPDILFSGTEVGLNYEGEGHLGLEAVITAAREAERRPGDPSAQAELERLADASRRSFVEDRRRDRDLLAMGKKILPVTKEDLYGEGALDRLVLQIIELLESGYGRNLADQRKMLQSKLIRSRRLKLIRSLLPGPQAEDARALLDAAEEASASHAFVIEEFVDF